MKLTIFLIVILFASNKVQGQRKGKCKTTSDSPDNFQKCKFPFTYKGETYEGCIPSSEKPGKTWCPTELDSNGVWGPDEQDEEYYGFCNDNCPLHSADADGIEGNIHIQLSAELCLISPFIVIKDPF